MEVGQESSASRVPQTKRLAHLARSARENLTHRPHAPRAARRWRPAKRGRAETPDDNPGCTCFDCARGRAGACLWISAALFSVEGNRAPVAQWFTVVFEPGGAGSILTAGELVDEFLFQVKLYHTLRTSDIILSRLSLITTSNIYNNYYIYVCQRRNRDSDVEYKIVCHAGEVAGRSSESVVGLKSHSGI
ncbi:hypothetical protein EVAR_32239_1 [Eumeta japonica]|uniref:Uncharacterized protein n=1 Tax=Eumeta variegata TaxID=151549 RepID=A0A4C1YIQ4_EUMVA|nr:hypothetical protein EVAR_32239_1 [Eumeta japonica]